MSKITTYFCFLKVISLVIQDNEVAISENCQNTYLDHHNITLNKKEKH